MESKTSIENIPEYKTWLEAKTQKAITGKNKRTFTAA
jgi:hypothetical protein